MFRDRVHAGQVLAGKLRKYAGRPDVIVVALPRGGVPIGYEVAKVLQVPLDVLVVRKLGVPGREELAMGAIACGGVRIVNEEVVQQLNIPEEWLNKAAERETVELERRAKAYRGDRPRLNLQSQTVLLVDDGLATGSTMRAAIAAIRQMDAREIIVAVPVGARETCESIRQEGTEVICVQMPDPFFAVGEWYEDFSQTSDEEVRNLLAS